MKRNHVLAGVLIFSMAAALVGLPSSAQEATKKAPAKGRLPPYYGEVVDDAERAKIYEIQAGYEARIDKLEAELEALKAERDEKVAKVLSPAKLKKVEELRAAAAAKREEKGKQDDKKVELKPGVKVEPKK